VWFLHRDWEVGSLPGVADLIVLVEGETALRAESFLRDMGIRWAWGGLVGVFTVTVGASSALPSTVGLWFTCSCFSGRSSFLLGGRLRLGGVLMVRWYWGMGGGEEGVTSPLLPASI
jgi:hypothetical protein